MRVLRITAVIVAFIEADQELVFVLLEILAVSRQPLIRPVLVWVIQDHNDFVLVETVLNC